MSKAGDASQQLAAALDRLKACRATDKNYVAASQEVLAEIIKLRPIGLDASADLMDLYQKLSLEFLYATKCAELRRPAFGGNTTSKMSKY